MIPDACPPVSRPPEVQAALEASAAAEASELEHRAAVDRAVMFSGEPHTARHLDGTLEEVRVRLLSVRQVGKFVSVWFGSATQDGDEHAALELACDRPAGWADTLDPRDVLRLLSRARALNFDLAAAWLTEQMEMLRMTRTAAAPQPPASPSSSPPLATSSG